MTEAEKIAEQLNALIEKCEKSGGHVYIVDKVQNRFAFRITEPIKVVAFIPTAKGENDG